jgi:hypothetical protein
VTLNGSAVWFLTSKLLIRFIREEGDDAPGGWEVQLAQKYYRKLFREYAVADLSRYKVAIS